MLSTSSILLLKINKYSFYWFEEKVTLYWPKTWWYVSSWGQGNNFHKFVYLESYSQLEDSYFN